MPPQHEELGLFAPQETYRSIVLWQPWASLIPLGLKGNETRSWPTSYRGKLLIHAAKRPFVSADGSKILDYAAWLTWLDALELDEAASVVNQCELPFAYQLPLGCVVAVVDLTACLLMVEKAEWYAWKDLKSDQTIFTFNEPTKELLFERSGFEAVQVNEPIKGKLAVPIARDDKGHWHEAIVISEQTELERLVGDWRLGRYAWRLENIQPLATPIPAKGQQGMWAPSPQLIQEVNLALGKPVLPAEGTSTIYGGED